jgi:hypothetical protein
MIGEWVADGRTGHEDGALLVAGTGAPNLTASTVTGCHLILVIRVLR